MNSLIKRLPDVKGKYEENFSLAHLTWFRVGGAAEVFFSPADLEDLCSFLKKTPDDIKVTIIGIGSNLLIRDGGIDGVVIRLGRGFNTIDVDKDNMTIRAGASVPDVKVAAAALKNNISGLSFMRGIPGTIGGLLRMNGGAYGRETSDVLVNVEAVDRRGNIHIIEVDDMNYSYRHSGADSDLIFVSGTFKGEIGDAEVIAAEMEGITKARSSSQPVRERTGGSTFKNPDGYKAWQLIDAAGMRGFQIGGAKVSEQHCNFLLNIGDATASDIEKLGEDIRKKVLENSGINLEWEIKIIGNKL